MNDSASNENDLDDGSGFDSDDHFFAPEELLPSPPLQVASIPPLVPSHPHEKAPRQTPSSATPTVSPTIFATTPESQLAADGAAPPQTPQTPGLADGESDFFDDPFAEDGPDAGSANEPDKSRLRPTASDPVSNAATRLKAALGVARGKIRISDAQTLAGFPEPDYYGRSVVGRAMQRNGWRRRRCRLDGKLGYAYSKGTPHERRKILEVERCDDGHVIVKSTSSSPQPRGRRSS